MATDKKISEIPYRRQIAFQGLQVTATPIGNLGDLSQRTKIALESADIIACEDTRHTGILLARLGIGGKKLIPYHDHSNQSTTDHLIEEMKNGKTVTLVSDAGTPLISDPGYELVAKCRNENIPVTSIPGPSALLAALAASGLPCDRFFFAGFLPNTITKKQEILKKYQAIPTTIIFYESPKRIAQTLKTMSEIYPERQAVVARELTKLHESFYHGSVAELAEKCTNETLKGEIVLILAPMNEAKTLSEDDIKAMIGRGLKDGVSRRDVVATIAQQTGWPKKTVYGIAITMPNDATEK